MTDTDRLAILEEIAELTEPPHRTDAEITLKEFAEHKGLSLQGARQQLDKAVAGGKLETRLVLINGHQTRVWSVVEAIGKGENPIALGS